MRVGEGVEEMEHDRGDGVLKRLSRHDGKWRALPIRELRSGKEKEHGYISH